MKTLLISAALGLASLSFAEAKKTPGTQVSTAQSSASALCKNILSKSETSMEHIWGQRLGCSQIKLNENQQRLNDWILHIQSSSADTLSGNRLFTITPKEFQILSQNRETLSIEASSKEKLQLVNITDSLYLLQHSKNWKKGGELVEFITEYALCSTPNDSEGLAQMLEQELNTDAVSTLKHLASKVEELKKFKAETLCEELQASIKSNSLAMDLLTQVQYEWAVPVNPDPKVKNQLKEALKELDPKSETHKALLKLLQSASSS